MKRSALPLHLALTLALVGCQSKYVDSSDPDVVGQQYIHQYGVTVSKDDWDARGRNGEIVSTRKDGVKLVKNYSAGVLDGESSYSFPNSHITQKIETYEQGTLVKTVENYASGLPKKEEEQTGANTKMVTCWYESGTPALVEEYEGNLLITGKYFTTKNEKESEVIAGNGMRTEYDGYGQRLWTDTIESGVMTSRMVLHPNGAPKEIVPYQNGVVSGAKKTYFAGGEPATLEQWVNGKQHGVTIEYRNGEKVAEVPYVRGKRHGIEKRYRAGSSVEQEIAWKDDQMHGPSRSYVGQDTRTDWYHEGRAVSKATFDQLNPAYR